MIKKKILLCLAGALYFLTTSAAAQYAGPMACGPFKPFPWMGCPFLNAFSTLVNCGFFNDFYNASFW
jgi:hypothetical protein